MVNMPSHQMSLFCGAECGACLLEHPHMYSQDRGRPFLPIVNPNEAGHVLYYSHMMLTFLLSLEICVI